MMAPRTSERLVQLFERDLREYDARDFPSRTIAPPPKRAPRVSDELVKQVIEFADETRTSGVTPEQMLVELKTILSTVAPDVPSSERNALVASLTGRAIDAFFKK
jgi:hypothetical protein